MLLFPSLMDEQAGWHRMQETARWLYQFWGLSGMRLC